jgi:hypothetical protein
LYFQALDDKGKCIGIYKDHELHFGDLPEGLQRTWKYAGFLKDRDIEYASIYCSNKELSEVCPEYLRDEWERVNSRMKAFYRSFLIAKINMNEQCFFDLVPRRFLINYCEIRNKITKNVFDNFEKPQNYEFTLNLLKIIHDIKYRKVNVDISSLTKFAHKQKYRKAINKFSEISPFCDYNIKGTVTGRLTTNPGSFPIMTMNKDFRRIIKPTNDFFVELDFNAAELRTLMYLAGHDVPPEDIHAWNAARLFPKGTSRSEAKRRLFSWLYDEDKRNDKLSSIYDRDKVREKYWKNDYVITFFKRKIPAGERLALSYIVQSTTADMVLRQMIKVNDILRDMESHIAFTIHDNIVLDMKAEERYIIPKIVEVFSDTELGHYMVNVRAGLDFGNLMDFKI